jgi:hypothetical protein
MYFEESDVFIGYSESLLIGSNDYEFFNASAVDTHLRAIIGEAVHCIFTRGNWYVKDGLSVLKILWY